MGTDEQDTPVRVKAALIDPASWTVVWTNDPDEPGRSPEAAALSLPVEQVVPMAEPLGVAEALRAVAETGEVRHLRADLVSTSRGSVAMVVSVHRLPDGMLLVLTENTVDLAQRAGRGTPARRGGRRR